MVEYYLARPEERQRIARNGQAYVYARHTYHHRAEEFLNALQTPAVGSKHDYGCCYTVDSNFNPRWRVMKVKRVAINMKNP